MKQYIIWKYIWISCIVQTLGQSLEKILKDELITKLRQERKPNHTKCSIKTTEGRKMEEKNRNKERG